jgi:hypothetical protein
MHISNSLSTHLPLLWHNMSFELYIEALAYSIAKTKKNILICKIEK